jgi:D-beta-D-heptose 7-phosphate kinase/D-beta-D-heptose 1-phosphate adenosyltransferase
MISTFRKVVGPGRLAAICARKRAQGKRVVFTNGCFDLLHVGHIRLLEKARALGDCLVVGLNTDTSMRGLKGLGRPLVPGRDRSRVIAALACVDYVTFFGEPTPENLIRKLKPSILVKGSDYTFRQIVGHQLVRRVVRIPLVKGRSSSALIRKVIRVFGRTSRAHAS